jgi:hypothetical protein
MAFNPAPSAWLTGYTSDGTNITIPIADVPNLTSAHANATTGDIRMLLYRIEAFLASQFAAAALAGNAPVEWTDQQSASLNQAGTQITFSFFQQFVTAVGSTEVIAEP